MAITYKGDWDASENLPSLSNGTGTTGDTYFIIKSGTRDLGSGIYNYVVGQSLIYQSGVYIPLSVTYTFDLINSTAVTGVSSVSGTSNRITVSPTTGATVVDIASTYVGQSSITTLGTITTGIWNGTAITNANLANSSLTVNGTSIALGASGTVTAAAGTLTGTTLNSTVVTTSITSTGIMTSGTLSTGYVVSGVKMTLGSDASYDIYYRGATGVLTRLANGTTGQALLATTSAAPSWGSAGSSYTFLTGLTNTAGTVTNNLSTGVSGGQTAIGGTGATDVLTFKSTTGNQTSGNAYTWLGGNNGATTLQYMRYNGDVTMGASYNNGFKLQLFGSLKIGGDAGQQTGSIALGDDNTNAMYNGMFRGTSTGGLGGGNYCNVEGYDGLNLIVGHASGFGANTPSVQVLTGGVVMINTTSNDGVNKLQVNGGATFAGGLTVTSTTQGLLPPRMTTTQKNAISSPAEGLMLYDLTLHQMSYYNGSTWINY